MVGKAQTPLTRIFLFLLDGEPHNLGEIYDWVTEYIEPQIATRCFMRCHADATDVPLEEMVTEGKRAVLRASVKRAEVLGYINVEWPEKEEPRHEKSRGYYDLRKCNIQITEKGYKHLFEGNGILKNVVSELKKGILSNRIQIKVEIKEDKEKFSFSDNESLVGVS
ncbi:hypothetical protein C4577_04935 [Candidatus Parcubacteria bacterium]|nr:MAG: hypothetical protein C4577_04935 [Candidatus Parcubacteria bacterium]